MTKEEIIEGNKLIAEYMGFTLVHIDYVGMPEESQWQKDNDMWMDNVGLHSVGEYFVNVAENKFFDQDDASYHSSWDWLMPVVKKIAEIDGTIPWKISVPLISTLDISPVWEGVVTRIKYLNQNLMEANGKTN